MTAKLTVPPPVCRRLQDSLTARVVTMIVRPSSSSSRPILPSTRSSFFPDLVRHRWLVPGDEDALAKRIERGRA